mgnify:CR=1 FL=1
MIAELTEQQIQDSKMNKKFLALIYEDEDNLPAYNFFKAEENPLYLLKDRTFKVTNSQLLYLSTKYMYFVNYWNESSNPTEYKHFGQLKLDHLYLTIKRDLMEFLIKSLANKKGVNILEYMGESAHSLLNGIVQGLNIPLRILCDDQIETCKRGLKGIDLDIELIEAEITNLKPEETKKFDYMALIAQYNSATKQNIDPLSIPLSLLRNYLNILDKNEPNS